MSTCKHDWDSYGKCCICGVWDLEDTRTREEEEFNLTAVLQKANKKETYD